MCVHVVVCWFTLRAPTLTVCCDVYVSTECMCKLANSTLYLSCVNSICFSKGWNNNQQLSDEHSVRALGELNQRDGVHRWGYRGICACPFVLDGHVHYREHKCSLCCNINACMTDLSQQCVWTLSCIIICLDFNYINKHMTWCERNISLSTHHRQCGIR